MGSYYYRWKNFNENDDEYRPEKPRKFGVTEIRSPTQTFLNEDALQDILQTMGQFVDGLSFSGGAFSLMEKEVIKRIIDLAHRHDVYVTTGDWAEYLLCRGSNALKKYIEECKEMGFDTIELNASMLKIPEEALLRCIRLIKSGGLKAKPHFEVKIEMSETPTMGDTAFGCFIASAPQKSESTEDVDLLIRKAERCLEFGADMIMINADDLCNRRDHLQADIIAKIISRLGLEKTMFEATDISIFEWFVKRYGPRVNLHVDHSQVMNLESFRSSTLGENLNSVISSLYFPM